MELKTLRTVRKTSSGQLYLSVPLEVSEHLKIREGNKVYMTVEKLDEK